VRLLGLLVAPQTAVTFRTVRRWPTAPRQAAMRSGASAIVPDDGAVRQPLPSALLIWPAPLELALQTWPERRRRHQVRDGARGGVGRAHRALQVDHVGCADCETEVTVKVPVVLTGLPSTTQDRFHVAFIPMRG
jgi:hypothetical protein